MQKLWFDSSAQFDFVTNFYFSNPHAMSYSPFRRHSVKDLDCVLAHSERVPKFDGVISGPRHNLPVVGRERHTHHVLCVTHKPPCGGTSVKDSETGCTLSVLVVL